VSVGDRGFSKLGFSELGFSKLGYNEGDRVFLIIFLII
jgi:hypothetical protein